MSNAILTQPDTKVGFAHGREWWLIAGDFCSVAPGYTTFNGYPVGLRFEYPYALAKDIFVNRGYDECSKLSEAIANYFDDLSNGFID